jgi:NitT/TauT family transport system substrate-binding protein
MGRHGCARAAVAALAALVIVTAGTARAAGDSVHLLVGGIDKQIYLPVRLADQLGYFNQQGIEVELQSEPSGVNAEDQLLTGAAQGVIGFYDHTIDLQAKGKSVESVVQLGQTPGEALVVATRLLQQVRSPADFKGRLLGVAGLGSSTEVLTRYLASVHGVKAADLVTVPVGAGDTFIEALKVGRIDAGMTTDPTVARLLKDGEAKVILDLRLPEETRKILGGPYPAACLYMESAWVKSHRAQVQKLVSALVKALGFIQAHGADAIASWMPADYFVGDRDLYVEALARNKPMFSPDGRMPAGGPETVLKVLSSVDRALDGKQIDLSRTYTMDFVAAAGR